MIIKNVHLGNDPEPVAILIKDGVFAGIGKGISDGAEPVLDGEGGMALPPFVEPHVHLDTVLTAGQPHWNKSGTLFEGIAIWAQRRGSLSREDVRRRALKAIKMQVAHGVQVIRSHVDVTDPELTALKALLELREELKEQVTLQIVAFPQEGILSAPRGRELLEEALKLKADAVGAIPHFEFTREDGVESLRLAFDLAQQYDVLVDVHCDEIDDEQSRFVEVVAAEALRREMGERVTASHTTAMGSYNDAYASRLFRVLKLSGISFVSNPLVNIHLQGRFDSYPKRRGLTRVKELNAAGMNVCFGHDDLFDPWYPLGSGNPLEVLHMGLHLAQLTGYSDINDSLKFIGSNGARALHVEAEYGIALGKPGNLIILPAENGFDALRRRTPVRYSIRQGRILAQTKPAAATVCLREEWESVDFRA